MRRIIKKISKTRGLAPGSLVHIGEKKVDQIRIALLDYNESELQEKKVEKIEECFPFKDKPTVTWINIDGLHDTELIGKLGKCFDLHPLILEDILGIDEDRQAKGGNLQYVKDTPNAIDDSIALVDAGEKQAAFFMNPIKMSQLIGVTDTGERMPQKSTYFYPKMFTGLTINKL